MTKYAFVLALALTLFGQETSTNFEEELLLFGDDLLLPDEPVTPKPTAPTSTTTQTNVKPSDSVAPQTSSNPADSATKPSAQTTTPIATANVVTKADSTPPVFVDTTAPTIIFNDSAETTEKSIAINENSSDYRSPKKALFLSLLVPGLGQGYVKRYWKSGLFGAIEIGAIVGAIVMNKKGDAIQAEAHDYADTYFDADNLTNFYKKLYTWGTNHEWYQDTTHNLDYNMFYGEYLNDTTPNGMMGYEKYVAAVKESPYEYAGDYTKATQGWSDMVGTYNSDPSTYVGEIAGTPQNFYFSTAFSNDPNESATYVLDDTSALAASSATFLRLIHSNRGSNSSGIKGHGYSSQQHHYNNLLNESQDAYNGSTAFIIALVVNHIASATDALLSARKYNRELLQETEEGPKSEPSKVSELLENVSIHNDLAYHGPSGVTTTVGFTWHF